MAERLSKIKEEPIIDERIPHPYREVIKELRSIKAQLEEISQKLAVTIPAPPVPPVVVPRVPPTVKIPAIQLPKEEFLNIYVEALAKFSALQYLDLIASKKLDATTTSSSWSLPADAKDFKILMFMADGDDIFLELDKDIGIDSFKYLDLGVYLLPRRKSTVQKVFFKAETGTASIYTLVWK